MKTIKSKLYFILSMSIFGLLLLLSFVITLNTVQTTNKNKEIELLSLVDHSKDIKSQILQARIEEQNYLTNPNYTGVENVKNNMQNIVTIAQTNSKSGNIDSEIKKQFTEILNLANQYSNDFETLTTLYEEIGYDSYEGLKGDIDSSVTELSSIINFSKDELMINQLEQLQQNEQLYVSTKNTIAYEEFLTISDSMINNISSKESLSNEMKSSIASSLKDYQEAINNIHTSYEDSNEYVSSFDLQSQSIQNVIVELEETVQKKQEGLNEQINTQNRLYILIMLSISCVLIFVLSIIGFLLLRNIMKSVHSLETAATKMGNGDLSYRAPITGANEMSKLAQTFNTMAEKVQKSFLFISNKGDQIQASSQSLAAISEETTAQANEVNAAIQQISIGATEQAFNLDKSLDIIKDVNQAISLTEQFSKEISSLSLLSEQQSTNGLSMVNELQSVSDQFLTLANNLSERVSSATEQSKNITAIVQTIEQIAENTNLLALNAAIEAARAGESGKGFSVVASEVRKLAEKSKEEALQIHSLVQQMGIQMEELKGDADKINHYKIQQGKSVLSTKQVFENISVGISDIHNKITGIDVAINNVQQANTVLHQNLLEVHEVSQSAAAATEEVSASSETQLEAISKVTQAASELNHISSELHYEVSQFTLNHLNSNPNPLTKSMGRKEKNLFPYIVGFLAFFRKKNN